MQHNFDFSLEPGKKINNIELAENKSPVISVIIPFYNDEKYIEQTITSILNQTFPLFEVIVFPLISPEISPIVPP